MYIVKLECESKDENDRYGMELKYNNYNIADNNFLEVVKNHVSNPLIILGNFNVSLIIDDKVMKIYRETL